MNYRWRYTPCYGSVGSDFQSNSNYRPTLFTLDGRRAVTVTDVQFNILLYNIGLYYYVLYRFQFHAHSAGSYVFYRLVFKNHLVSTTVLL